IIEKWELVEKGRQSEEYFYNKVLGLPYAGSDNKVSEEAILGSVTDDPIPTEGRMVIGVDSGIKLRWFAMNKGGGIGYGECEDWAPREPSANDPRPAVRMEDSIEHFLAKWPNSILVCDAGGDILGVRKL